MTIQSSAQIGTIIRNAVVGDIQNRINRFKNESR
jgi:hypothetical protein